MYSRFNKYISWTEEQQDYIINYELIEKQQRNIKVWKLNSIATLYKFSLNVFYSPFSNTTNIPNTWARCRSSDDFPGIIIMHNRVDGMNWMPR